MPFRLWHRSPPPPGDDRGLWLVVGLGNPGSRYAQTRHNVGFMVVERLAEQSGLTFRGSKQRAEIARGVVASQPTLLALPVTYMNESGIAVSRLVQYYHIPLDHLLVVCDDLDLPFGRLRLRPRGSSGGNGGLKSIIRELGTEEFARLRVGVGRPRGGTVSYVLDSFPPEQTAQLPTVLDAAADAVSAVLSRGVAAAMNDFNRDWLSAS